MGSIEVAFGRRVSDLRHERLFQESDSPSNGSSNDAAESTRKHSCGNVQGEPLRLLLFLIPRRQNEQDSRCESSFEDAGSNRYRIYFTGSVAGLKEGSPVRYRGIALGAVRDIRIDPRNVSRVQVTIEVSSQLPKRCPER